MRIRCPWSTVRLRLHHAGFHFTLTRWSRSDFLGWGTTVRGRWVFDSPDSARKSKDARASQFIFKPWVGSDLDEMSERGYPVVHGVSLVGAGHSGPQDQMSAVRI